MKEVIIATGGNPNLWPNIHPDENKIWIGVDRGALHLIERNIIPNIAIGDFDSLSKAEYEQVKREVANIYTAKPEKDETDTELALFKAIALYPEARFTIIGATGGRLDHFLANLWLPFDKRVSKVIGQIRLIDKQNIITYYSPGSYKVKKEMKAPYLAFVCLTPVEKLTLEAVKYPLYQLDVPFPKSFASNEFLGDTARFSFEKGMVAVIQSKDI